MRICEGAWPNSGLNFGTRAFSLSALCTRILSTDIVIDGPGADKLTVQRDTGGDYGIVKVTTNGEVTLAHMRIECGNFVNHNVAKPQEGTGDNRGAPRPLSRNSHY